MIRSILFSPLHARLETAYKAKEKLIGHQHQGPWIDGDRVVKSGGANIIQAQKETPCVCYYNLSKEKSKLVVDAALKTTHTTEDHRAVTVVIKKS